MKWASFWERFEAAVDTNDQLSVSHKLTYLREAVKDPKVSPLLYSGTSSDDDLYPGERIALCLEVQHRGRLLCPDLSGNDSSPYSDLWGARVSRTTVKHTRY